MKLSILKERDKSFAYIFLSLSGLLAVSAMTNLVLAGYIVKNHNKERVITVPMAFDQPFESNSYSGDLRLNEMMVRSLINLRLNVTPETIDSQQEAILRFSDPRNRSELKRSLITEAQYIKSNDISSNFSIESIKYDPSNGNTYVTGTLSASTSAGKLDLPDDKRSYVIKVQYVDGQLNVPLFSPYKAQPKS